MNTQHDDTTAETRDRAISEGTALFGKHFGTEGDVEIFFSPGRVNLIGEHLDYNGGPVFPAAISVGIYAFARPRADGIVRMRSAQFNEEIEIMPAAGMERPRQGTWGDFPAGVVMCFMNAGRGMPRGCDVFFMSTMPDGAGLSSSASLEVLTACALYETVGDSPGDRVDVALLCQKAENEYVGVQCGIMDQFAVAMGKAGHAILLDTGTLGYRHVPLRLGEYSLVIMNSNKRRELAGSKYNERRGECERALEEMRAARQELTCLANATPGDLASVTEGTLRKRARHVMTETARVNESVRLLDADDLETFGTLMIESHRSLQSDYEVTGHELDSLVDAALEVDGCIGARMTGAGFGGCALALVHGGALGEFEKWVRHRYAASTGLDAGLFTARPENGAGRI